MQQSKQSDTDTSQQTSEKKEVRVLPGRNSYVLRGIVGGYLIFLAYSVVQNLGTATKSEYLIFTLTAAAFTLLGVALIAVSVKAIVDGRYRYGKKDPVDPEADEKGEAPRKRIEFGEELSEEQQNAFRQEMEEHHEEKSTGNK